MTELKGKFFLAPLAGVSDSPFRTICFLHGAAYACTEMVSAKGLYYNNPNTEELLYISGTEGPVGIQLFGSEPEMLKFAAAKLRGRKNIMIDINMGCPVPKVVKNHEGSALLCNPELAARLVRAAADAAGKPVSVKMRTGFGKEYFDAPSFARLMEENGASAIAVHGRTREQYYSGKADWDAIKAVVKAVQIPVIGNGDVFSGEDGCRMLDYTGCSAVMIGRGSLGNPWIFEECNAMLEGRGFTPPEREEIKKTVKQHIELALERKSEYRAIRQMRSQIGWYTRGIKGGASLRTAINSAETKEQIMEIIEKL